MKRIIATILATFAIALGVASPAMANVPAGGYGDGPKPTVKAQKAACKPVIKALGKKSATVKLCKELAKLPKWWIHIDGTNYQVNDGPTLIKLTIVQPCNTWDAEFAWHITRFKDNHASIQV